MKLIKYLALATATLWGTATIASACPDLTQTGAQYSYSSDDLWNEQTLSVTAGGSVDLGGCAGIPGTGNVISSPDFSIAYNRTQDYDVRFTVDGSCDTVLLINDATGSWHFDDDSGDGSNPLIRLDSPAGGKIDVWIGTYGDSTCAASLHMESFP